MFLSGSISLLTIENPNARFCLGVQWHPEWLSDADPAMQGLFDAFVNACSK